MEVGYSGPQTAMLMNQTATGVTGITASNITNDTSLGGTLTYFAGQVG